MAWRNEHDIRGRLRHIVMTTKGSVILMAATGGALNAFIGNNPQGTWALSIADLIDLDVGTLNAAMLTIFYEDCFALNVAKTGTGSGNVTGSPSGIDCGADSSKSYDNGSSAISLPSLTQARPLQAGGGTKTAWMGRLR